MDGHMLGMLEFFGSKKFELLKQGGLSVMGRVREGLRTTKSYRICGYGSDVVFGTHNASYSNLIKGLVTRVFTVEYKQWMLGHRLERDRDACGAFEREDYQCDCPAVQCHPMCTGERWKRLRLAVDCATSGPRGIPFPPVVGFYTRSSIGEFCKKVVSVCPKIAPVDLEEVPGFYRGRKKAIYEAAYETVSQVGFKASQAVYKCFMKLEKLNLTDKVDPDPRVIQPRPPEFHLQLAAFIRPIEKVLCKAVGKVYGHATITKGMNADDVGRVLKEKWDMFEDPVAVGADASRFDQSVSVEALAREHQVYIDLVPTEKDKKILRRLLDCQLRNKGRAYIEDKKVKYETIGVRGSGDLNTGLGNCLISCMLIWAYLNEKGIRGQLANNGDDCVVFMERKDLHNFSQGFGELFADAGFTMVVEEPVYELEKVDFCQASPVWDGEAWRMVRNARTSLSKDAVCLLQLESNESFATWLDAVGQCGIALAGDMPVVGAYYQGMIRNANQLTHRRNGVARYALEDSGMFRLAQGLHHKYKQPTDDARVSFYNAFGILPDVQLAMERYYMQFNIDPQRTDEEAGRNASQFNYISAMGLLC